MANTESLPDRQALEQGRQILLELAFACAKNLISPWEYQIPNRTYNLAELLFPCPNYRNLEIPRNWTGVRIRVSRVPGSEIPPFWPANTTNEVLEYIFSLTKEQSLQGINFECEYLFIDGDKRRLDKGLPSGTITALTNDLLTLLSSPKLTSSKTQPRT